jgi:uncharacterized protein YccT (UPF0319 family)
MTYRTMLLMLLSAFALLACSTASSVKFYEGPTRPDSEIAIITVPAAITMRSIDGQNVKSPSKDSGTYEVQLQPGPHLVVFRYYSYWAYGDAGVMVKSNDVGVEAVYEAGKHYLLRYQEPHSFEEAKAYFSEFHATLVDINSGKQYSSFEVSDQNSLFARIKNYFDPNGAPKVTPPTTTAVAPMAAATTVAATNTAASPTLSADAAMNEDPVKRLKFWWLMANDTQRKEFTKWMKTATESFAPETKPAPVTKPAKSPAAAPAVKTPVEEEIKIKP